MRITSPRFFPAFALASTLILALAGCKEEAKPKTGTPQPGGTPTQAPTASPGHDGKVIALGDGDFGPYKLKATRDVGVIKAGGDAPIDVTVDPAGATAPKVVAVRFWIGLQDGAGSVKAKAEIEDPKAPTRWHTHAEVSDPIAPGSKLWVEIEDEKGVKTLASFDLKS